MILTLVIQNQEKSCNLMKPCLFYVPHNKHMHEKQVKMSGRFLWVHVAEMRVTQMNT